MARPEKEATVAALTAKLQQSHGVIVTDYRGLRVRALSDLRRQMRAAGGEYVVAKNTLLRRAADQAGMSGLSELLSGPTAVLFAPPDATAAAKALLAFARQNSLPQVRGLVMGGKLYSPAAVQDLATLPGRDVMLGLVVGAFQGPIAGLASTLQGILGELGATLQALARQREAVSA